MLKSFLVIALRRIKSNKLFFVMNVLGLMISTTIVIMAYLVISRELSFEDYVNEKEKIFRVVTEMKYSDKEYGNSGVPVPFINVLKSEITGINTVAPFYLFFADVSIAKSKGSTFKFKQQPGIIFADHNYFKLFERKWIVGEPQVSLTSPLNVVLAESRAKTYFPDIEATNIIGKTVTYNDTIHAVVTGIIRDSEDITDFDFNEFISLSSTEQGSLSGYFSIDSWMNINSAIQVFVKLDEQDNTKMLEDQFRAILKKNRSDDAPLVKHKLQNIKDVHFNDRYDVFFKVHGNKSSLNRLMSLGIFILILGIINYINLTTADQLSRSKEMGVFKLYGSNKFHIAMQFFVESFLVSALSILLAFGSIALFAGQISDVLPMSFDTRLIIEPSIIYFLIFLLSSISLLSSIYPFVSLSRFTTSNLLGSKTDLKTRWSGLSFRQFLIMFQFVVAQLFLVLALVAFQQTEFINNKDLGYKSKDVLMLEMPNRDLLKANTLINKLSNLTEIDRASFAGYPPSSLWTEESKLTFAGKDANIITKVEFKYVSPSFIEVYGIKLLAGNDLSVAPSTREYLINETYSKMLGFSSPEESIGQMIGKRRITGVVGDFHTKSLHNNIGPIVLQSDSSQFRFFHIKLHEESTSMTSALEKIKITWNAVYPDEDFNYKMINEYLASIYSKEAKLYNLLTYSALIAGILNCIGLFGLIIFYTRNRSKEIAIRKINGASNWSIVILLSSIFIKLVVMGLLLASPLAWYLANDWLSNYAFHVKLNPTVFMVSGIAIVFISMITISVQVIGAATCNPSETLRNSN